MHHNCEYQSSLSLLLAFGFWLLASAFSVRSPGGGFAHAASWQLGYTSYSMRKSLLPSPQTCAPPFELHIIGFICEDLIWQRDIYYRLTYHLGRPNSSFQARLQQEGGDGPQRPQAQCLTIHAALVFAACELCTPQIAIVFTRDGFFDK